MPGTISAAHRSAYPGRSDRATVVFLPGVYHGSWAFEDFRRPFTKAGNPVVLLDLRGHRGEHRLTPRSNVGYLDYLEDVHQTLDAIPGRKILVGHSLGGLLAISALSRPDLAANVIMAAPLPEAIRSTQWRLLLEFPIRTAWFLVTGNASALYHYERFTDRYFFSRSTPTSAKATANAWIRQQHEPARLFREIMSLQFFQAVRPLPTLIVLGEEDPTVTAEVGEKLRLLTGGDVLVVPNAGHDLMLEPSSEIAARLIVEWISSQRSI